MDNPNVQFLWCRCGSGDWTVNMAQGFIQSVENGEHPHCPPAQGATPAKTIKSSASVQSSTSDLASEVLYAYEHFYGRAPLGQVKIPKSRTCPITFCSCYKDFMIFRS
jgi:hypothetical protein